jgi:hypothetical protein
MSPPCPPARLPAAAPELQQSLSNLRSQAKAQMDVLAGGVGGLNMLQVRLICCCLFALPFALLRHLPLAVSPLAVLHASCCPLHASQAAFGCPPA